MRPKARRVQPRASDTHRGIRSCAKRNATMMRAQLTESKAQVAMMSDMGYQNIEMQDLL